MYEQLRKSAVPIIMFARWLIAYLTLLLNADILIEWKYVAEIFEDLRRGYMFFSETIE